MHAAGREHRGYAREVDRRAQERLAQRAALFVVEQRLAFGVGVADRGVALALVDEGGGDDVAVAQALAFAVEVVVDHAEAVAFAQVLGEVDVVAERVGELEHHRVAQAGLFAGIEQRARDHAVGDVGATFDRAFHRRFGDAVAVEVQHHAGRVVALETHRLEHAVVDVESEFLAGTDAAQCGGVVLRIERALQVGRAKAFLAEDVRQRLAGAHADDAPVRFRVAVHAVGADGWIGFRAGRQLRQVQRHRRIGCWRGLVARRVGPGRQHDADQRGQQQGDATKDPVFGAPGDRRAGDVLQERPIRAARIEVEMLALRAAPDGESTGLAARGMKVVRAVGHGRGPVISAVP